MHLALVSHYVRNSFGPSGNALDDRPGRAVEDCSIRVPMSRAVFIHSLIVSGSSWPGLNTLGDSNAALCFSYHSMYFIYKTNIMNKITSRMCYGLRSEICTSIDLEGQGQSTETCDDD